MGRESDVSDCSGEDVRSTDTYELKYIQPEGNVSPATAVVDGIHELQQMGELARTNLKK